MRAWKTIVCCYLQGNQYSLAGFPWWCRISSIHSMSRIISEYTLIDCIQVVATYTWCGPKGGGPGKSRHAPKMNRTWNSPAQVNTIRQLEHANQQKTGNHQAGLNQTLVRLNPSDGLNSLVAYCNAKPRPNRWLSPNLRFPEIGGEYQPLPCLGPRRYVIARLDAFRVLHFVWPA